MSDERTLKKLLEETNVKSAGIVMKAEELQKTGNFVKEITEVSIDCFDKSPMKDNPNIYIADFQKVREELNKVELHLGAMQSLASGLSYGTASAVTTLSGTLTPHNYRSNPSYAEFYTQLDQVIDRGQTRDQVISEIKKLGLDTISEGRDAINLLESAWKVHIQRTGISTSTLIPLRESIEKILLAIRRKTPPPQLKLKKWIIDLGNRIAFSNISFSDLKNLQDEHDVLRDRLSGSKSGNYSRNEERTLLREGTLHLLKILNIVDSSKLR